MQRVLKLKLAALATLATFVLLAGWLLSRVDVKSEFEASASKTTGLQVTVEGKAAVRFFPKLHVSLTNTLFKSGAMQIASIGEADIGVDFLPLLHRQVRIKRVALQNVTIELDRDPEGKLNIFETPRDEHTMHAASMQVTLRKVNFIYNNRQTAKKLSATNCMFDSNDFEISEGSSAEFMRHLSLAARIACKEVRDNHFIGTDVHFPVAGRDGILKFSPITLQMMSGSGSGVIDADFTGATPVYKVHYVLEQLRVEELFKSIAPSKVGGGQLDFSADLVLRGRNAKDLTRNADGIASLHGKDLQLKIGNLDEKLKRYESSQNFNLIDIGAFFIVGPLGPAVTKGYSFATIFQDTQGDTRVQNFVSQWNIKQGVAHAQDVAMSTQDNRLAMKGALDFVNKRFDDVIVATIDEKGCARVEQKISGPFAKPEIEKPNVLRSLAGPVSRLVSKVKDLGGGKCDAFYAGSVSPPSASH